MHRSLVLCCALLSTTLAGQGCGCNGKRVVERPYVEPTVEDFINHNTLVREAAMSFKAESIMDYWVGNERVRGTVLIMGKRGARMRFNALSPTGDNVAADMACNGVDFKYVDYNNNCQVSGACTSTSIAHLLRVNLEPDDFLLLAVGSTPILADADGTITWDASKGYEVVDLISNDNSFTQKIIIDGRHGREQWAVVESTVRDAKGNIEWRLKNKDFKTVKAEDGTEFRVPTKTRFEQPKDKADLIVKWKKRVINLELDDAKWEIEIPEGIPPC